MHMESSPVQSQDEYFQGLEKRPSLGVVAPHPKPTFAQATLVSTIPLSRNLYSNPTKVLV